MGCILQTSPRWMEHSWDRRLCRGGRKGKKTHTRRGPGGCVGVEACEPETAACLGGAPTDVTRKAFFCREIFDLQTFPSPGAEVCVASAPSWRRRLFHCGIKKPPVWGCVHVSDNGSGGGAITHVFVGGQITRGEQLRNGRRKEKRGGCRQPKSTHTTRI